MKKSIITTILFATIFLLAITSFGEDLVIDQNGNVGIGTTEPSKKLEVEGDVRIRSTNKLYFGSAGNDVWDPTINYDDSGYLHIKARSGYGIALLDGNVGIGTTSPAQKLEVNSGDIFIRSTSNPMLRFGHNDTTTWASIYRESATGKLFIRNDQSNPIILDNGNIGIGTTSPSYPLHVYRSDYGNTIVAQAGGYNISLYPHSSWGHILTNAPKFYFDKEIRVDSGLIGSYDEDLSLRTQGTTRMTVLNSNGNVGIAKTNPSEKLDVNGNIKCNQLIGNVVGSAGPVSFGVGQIVTGYDPWTGQPIYADAVSIGMGGYAKTFVIDHPTDDSKYLVHATLEGPEAGVYYRGSARCESGEAVIKLPPYFEALTRQEGRTVMLTNIDGFDRLMVKRVDSQKIKDGKFLVVAENAQSTQEFDWEVKAIRKDVAPLDVEPYKDDLIVRGNGPYTYGIPVSGGREQ